MLQEGDRIENFTLKGIDQEGIERDFMLKEILSTGKPLVLYFYPRDNTPGCTKEACEFRDNMNRITKMAQVVGVSPDSIRSHKNFQKKHSLNFPLLSDPEKTLLRHFGAWGEKKVCGKTKEGVIRSTFIIDPEGVIRKAWRNVKVKGHVDEVIETLKKLSS